jgi:hypothetical protein
LIRRLSEKILPVVAQIGVDPDDSDEVRLQKTLLTLGSFMFIAAGTSWDILYSSFGEFIAGSIPPGYARISSLSVLVSRWTHRYRFFLFMQLLLILFLPFLLMIALGGFIRSSAVILWSILSPLGALLFGEPRGTVNVKGKGDMEVWLVVSAKTYPPQIRQTNSDYNEVAGTPGLRCRQDDRHLS